MKVVILTVGSRGDVQPLVALAHGLQQAGHDIRLAAHSGHRELVERHRVEYVEMPANPTGSWKREEESFRATFARHLRQWTVAGLEFCQDAEAIIYTPLAISGYDVAEKLGVPAFRVRFDPSWPTREYPSIFLKSRFSLGSGYNLLTHTAGDLLFWFAHRSTVNRVRRDVLGLPPIGLAGPFRRMHRQRIPQLFAYSEFVVPKPADWGEWLHVTGYWFLGPESRWSPAPELVSFLEAGPRPLLFDMGSIDHPQLRPRFVAVLEGLRRSGERVILGTGRVQLTDVELPEGTYRLDAGTPHSWLLPRVAAVLCHGGANTVGACLRAGAPTTVLPTWGHTFFWGRRLHELGVGAPPLTMGDVTAERVQEAVRIMLSPEVRERSAELGRKISAQRGVDRAVEAIHLHV